MPASSPASSPPTDRRRAAAIAGHTNDIETARRALSDDDPLVRAIALGALDRIGALDDETLRQALTDTSSEVRVRACELVATASRRGVSLLATLDDPDVGVIEMAAFAAGEQASAGHDVDHAVLKRLVEFATGHDDALVREAAVAALGAIAEYTSDEVDDRAAVDAILAALGDKPAIRRRAVIALASFEGDDVETALARARTDRDWQVRQAAEDLS